MTSSSSLAGIFARCHDRYVFFVLYVPLSDAFSIPSIVFVIQVEWKKTNSVIIFCGVGQAGLRAER